MNENDVLEIMEEAVKLNKDYGTGIKEAINWAKEVHNDREHGTSLKG